MSTTFIGSALSWWVDGCRRFAWPIVLVALVLAALSLQYTRANIDFDTDTADMIARDLSWRQNYIAFKEEFPQFVDTLLIVVDADTPDLAEAAADRLADAVDRESGLVEWVERPGDSAFFRRNGLLYLDEDALERLSDSLARAQPFLGRLSEEPTMPVLFSLLRRAMTEADLGAAVELTPVLNAVADAVEASRSNRFHRLGWQNLLRNGAGQEDASRRFVVVKPKLDYRELFPAAPVLNRLRALESSLGLTPARGVRMRITGEPVLSHEELKSAAEGTAVALVLALVMVVAVLLIGLRSVWLLFATVMTLLVGLCFTAAFATLAIGRLNLISVAFAVLYIGLGVDYAIHYCLRCRELRLAGERWRDALNRSAGDVGVALALCALTTGIGFFAFVPTDFTGVSELGIISGTGMFISLAVSLTVLPALLEVLPQPRPVTNADSHRAAEAAISWPLRHRRGVRAAAVVIALASLFLLPWARFDDNPLNLRDPQSESVSTVRDLMADGGRSPWTLSVMVANEREARALAGRLEGLPEVSRVMHLGHLVPENQARKVAIIDDLALLLGLDTHSVSREITSTADARRDAAAALVRALDQADTQHENQAQRAAARRLKEGLAGLLAADSSAPALAALEQSLMYFFPAELARLHAALAPERVTRSSLPDRLVRDWVTPAGDWRLEVQPAGDLNDSRVLENFVSSVRGIAPGATGAPVVHVESGRAVVGAFTQALVAALVLISVLLFAVLRRVLEVGLVMAPLLLAMLVTVALMAAFGLPFNFANVIALPLLLGLGANNGIHMVYRMRAAPPHSGNLLKTSTARGVVFSALTTMCSFGNLAFASHRGTASMGILLTIGLTLVLVSTLVLTPALQPRRTDYASGNL